MSKQYTIGDLLYDFYTNCFVVISDNNKMIVVDSTQKKTSIRQIPDDKIR